MQKHTLDVVQPVNAPHRMTSVELINALRAEHQRYQLTHSKEKTESAHYANANQDKSSNMRGRGRGRSRGRGGHHNFDCKGKKKEIVADKDATCYKCGDKGHKSPSCPSKEKTYQRQDASSATAESKATSSNQTSQSNTQISKSEQANSAYITDRKSTRLNSSHSGESRMPSSA